MTMDWFEKLGQAQGRVKFKDTGRGYEAYLTTGESTPAELATDASLVKMHAESFVEKLPKDFSWSMSEPKVTGAHGMLKVFCLIIKRRLQAQPQQQSPAERADMLTDESEEMQGRL